MDERERQIVKQQSRLDYERMKSRRLSIEMEKSDQLLTSVMPPKIVKDLMEGQGRKVNEVDNVSICFSDIVGFSKICQHCKVCKKKNVMTLFIL